MTYFADLAPLTYLGRCRGDARAVGWLEADHDFRRGDVAPAVVTALESLLLHTWAPVETSGWHDCSLCGRQPEDGPITRQIAGSHEVLGVRNLLVPAGQVIYGAPSLILHYIEEHGYQPPAEFIAALLTLDPTAAAYRVDCQRIWYGN